MILFDYALPKLCVDAKFLMFKQKKKITYCATLFLVITEGIATYGIKAGSSP
jgi:hypothetical protein